MSSRSISLHREEVTAVDERRTALAFVGPSAAPLLLHSWWSLGEIGENDLRSLLPGAWKGVEFPQRSLKRSRWSELFAAAGFVSEPPERGDSRW